MLFAQGWDEKKLRRSLRQKNPANLADFILARHEQRFLQPLRVLKGAPGNWQGYGFSMLALCSLLIETIQSYRDGLPTTDRREFKKLVALKNIPATYRLSVTDWKSRTRSFQRFFRDNRVLFQRIPGASFYKKLRCGILHQGQTKGGWMVDRSGSGIWTRIGRQQILYRDSFFTALDKCFDEYANQLRASGWNSKMCRHAAGKVWWLIKLS